ncbi:hypothetical protein MKZ38_002087 [Zalerion maritima]|uniref:Uncharacterized protein n=1 Tax=Zalerion maritima TaxID=339359 RepID=A0AAD5S5B8_9PEZI|nr:hypothetical protein MKZ38_002087 [Zalerion maritima]
MFSGILFLATGLVAPAAVIALSPPYTTPPPDPECVISDSATACPTYANCYGSSCSSSGCAGFCAPTSSCTLGSPSRTCEDAGDSCTPFYTTCTSDGCFGACVATATPPTPCKLDDPSSSCNQTPISSCAVTAGCTTSGCEGTCTARNPCNPTATGGCPVGEFCSSHSGSGYCHTAAVTPTPTASACKIDDPSSSCDQTPRSSCAGADGCTTPGCEGTCTLRKSCNPTATGGCPVGEFCSSHSGSGYCHTPTVSPTPTGSACKIDDMMSSCGPTPISSCAGAGDCTTSGCEGTCTARQGCDPDSTDSPSECPGGEFCSSHSGAGYCHTTAVVTGGGTETSIDTTEPTPDSSSSSSSSRLGPECTIGGDGCSGRCYTCIDLSGACTTPGCVADCLGLPCATFDTTDTYGGGGSGPTDTYDGGSVTVDGTSGSSPTEPPLKTRTYDCLVSVTGGCGLGQQCEPWYGQCCDTLNCPGKCVDVGGGSCATEVEVTMTVTVYTTA